MPQDDLSSSGSQGLPEPVEYDPLTRWQRAGASAIGTALAGAGAVSVFAAENQAGSVALLVIGGAFLLVAVSGLPIHGAKVKDWEIWLGARRRQVVERASSAPPDQAGAILDVLRSLDPAAGHDPTVTALEVKIFENRVIAAAEAARAEGEQVDSRLSAGLGEPLVVFTSEAAGARIGIFAAYAGNPSGRISRSTRDRFVRRAREVGCDGFLFVNGMLQEEDLSDLAVRLEREGRLPVVVESWEPATAGRSLRPAIDRVVERVRDSPAGSGAGER